MSEPKEINQCVPDAIRPHLNEIAQRLWADRAVVMVGSGFSKNAGNEFPDWNQLGDLFYQKAHGIKPDAAKLKYLNVLRLAEEVQAAIGRPALENLLRSSIPDLSIEPSDLHVKLLELPWVDVFTTNYDTLLERASAEVVTRRYEPVVNKEDIPYAIKPRIVKLHGSFPSERPFIITEEDYRRYPHDNAPFVNTVQQALLENTFCLIGFSGDDPNFLQWIGWIRDNLGKDKTQKIYLVGVFNLSSARLQLLAQRGIIVVDFSCCDGIENHEHKKALTRFFDYIRSQKPDALNWPHNAKNLHPTRGADRIQEIQNITVEWRRQRQCYPGWLILPHENREKLWAFTNAWTEYLPDTIDAPPGLDIEYAFELIWRLERCLLPIFTNIAEFCEKILEKYWPFHDGNPPESCKIRLGEEPFQDLAWNDLRQAWIYIALAMLRFYREEGCLDKWQELENRLKNLSEHLSAEQREFLNYDGVLFSIFNLDMPEAKQRLNDWRPNETKPYWKTKRATALAELSQLSDADDQIRLSLVESRRRGHDSDMASSRYRSVSNESFQILLLNFVKNANHWTVEKPATIEEEKEIKEILLQQWRKDKQTSAQEREPNSTVKPIKEFFSFDAYWQYFCENRLKDTKPVWDQHLRTIRDKQRKIEQQQQNARLNELKAFRCDPWNELKHFELALKKPPIKTEHVTKKREFDIGRVTTTHHYQHTDQEALNAFAFLRFCEEIGLPYRVGIHNIAKETALATLERIFRYSPFWAIATLIRVGDSKAVDSLFSRESVCNYTASDADQLIHKYLDALNKCRGDVQSCVAFRDDNYGVRLAQLLPEVISRLCCKCTSDSKRQILEFITAIYSSSYKSNYRNVKHLTSRFINSLSEIEQFTFIPDLLKVPFPGDLNIPIEDEFPNPFLFLELNQRPENTRGLDIQSEWVDHLLRNAESENVDRRRWAVTSLITLHHLQLLDDAQSRNLASAIWCVTDQYGLPRNTDFYKFVFLGLPSPQNIEPPKLFKHYVKSTSFPIQKNKKDDKIRFMGGHIPIVHEIIGSNSNDECFWTDEDAEEILQRVLQWWDADKDRLSEKEDDHAPFSSIPEEFEARFSRMVELLTEFVGPNLGTDLQGEVEDSLARLLQEIQERGLPFLAAEAACLHIYPNRRSNLLDEIEEALLSNQDKRQKDGLRALETIIVDKRSVDPMSAEPYPEQILSQFLIWSPTISVNTALLVIVRILKNKSSIFSHNLEKAVQNRLDRLLCETDYETEYAYMTFEQKLEIRRVSSILASELWKDYKSRSLSIPMVFDKWREACQSPDEFSEISNPWIT